MAIFDIFFKKEDPKDEEDLYEVPNDEVKLIDDEEVPEQE